jgi:hypothetical protein
MMLWDNLGFQLSYVTLCLGKILQVSVSLYTKGLFEDQQQIGTFIVAKFWKIVLLPVENLCLELCIKLTVGQFSEWSLRPRLLRIITYPIILNKLATTKFGTQFLYLRDMTWKGYLNL